ncbi:hypothetical protein I546_3026 [Mycobacterium kansasii 732]|nr:hypothetical protein I546_3026 [Mycobacterium kansasii 732]
MKVVETARGWLAAVVVAGAFVDCGALFLVLLQAATIRMTTERPATILITAAREANNMGTAPFGLDGASCSATSTPQRSHIIRAAHYR